MTKIIAEYDSRCEDLAEIFLADYEGSPTDLEARRELAQVIQNAIEDWLGKYTLRSFEVSS